MLYKVTLRQEIPFDIFDLQFYQETVFSTKVVDIEWDLAEGIKNLTTELSKKTGYNVSLHDIYKI